MTHASHHMHSNSLESYYSIKYKLTGRRAKIFKFILLRGKCTDRQVMTGLGFQDMNSVRPRISELVEAGALVEVATVIDQTTKKPVRVVDVRREPEQLSIPLQDNNMRI